MSNTLLHMTIIYCNKSFFLLVYILITSGTSHQLKWSTLNYKKKITFLTLYDIFKVAHTISGDKITIYRTCQQCTLSISTVNIIQIISSPVLLHYFLFPLASFSDLNLLFLLLIYPPLTSRQSCICIAKDTASSWFLCYHHTHFSLSSQLVPFR